MQQQMEISSGGGGGGFEPNRGGLTRFRSAPATWLDTLLQDGEISENQFMPHASGNNSTSNIIRNSADFSSNDASFFGSGETAGTSFGFFRQNSSPAELLAQLNPTSGFVCDGYFSNSGISANNQDCVSMLENQSNKRERELESERELSRQNSAKFSSQLKGESSVRVPSRMDSLSDLEMEKLFEDSVPCRVRAKRGFATHPRSIAERVRRTRISDRIRKLQELVPNMDKQTNTADMLEEAVEYVKSLQKQIQELSEHQRKCKCIDKD